MFISQNRATNSGERMQYSVHRFNDNTLRFVLSYPGVLDADALCAATGAVVNSVDILHSTYLTDGARLRWHINEDVSPNLFFNVVETDGEPTITAASLCLAPISPKDMVQMYVTLVRNRTASSLVLRISHLVADGSDGKYLLNKLEEAYRMILGTGSAQGLVVKNGNRAPEQLYEQMDFQDKKSLLSGMPSFGSTAYPYPSGDPGWARIVQAVIPADLMSAARAKAKQAGASANDLLLTACYHACAAMEGVDPTGPMSISSMIDLRRNLEGGDSKGICNLSGNMPTTLEHGIGACFADTLDQVARQTRQAKQAPYAGMEGMPLLHCAVRTMPSWVIQAAVNKVYGGPSISLTNLGNLIRAEHAMGELVPSGGLCGGPVKKKPGMQVSIISFDGECVMTVLGCYTKEDAGALQSTLDTMVQEIAAYAAQ